MFFVGLRVDRNIVNFLDQYHYGTRSDVVRNIIYERIASDDPTKMFNDLIKSYEVREIDTRTFLKRYMVLKNRCKEILEKYSDLDHELYNLNVNELVGRLRLEDEIDNYF